MSKYFSISLLAFLLMLVPSACSQSKPDSLQLDNPSCITFNNGFKTKNDDAILSFIANSIKYDSLSYKSYLIIKSIDFPFFSQRVKKGFWVGPLYRKMTTEHSTIMIPKNHIQSLSNEKNIYIYKKTIKKDTVQSKIIFCDPDSTYIMNGIDTMFVTTDAFVNYVKRTKLFQIKRNCIFINNQPDTLVLPKIIRDTLNHN